MQGATAPSAAVPALRRPVGGLRIHASKEIQHGKVTKWRWQERRRPVRRELHLEQINCFYYLHIDYIDNLVPNTGFRAFLYEFEPQILEDNFPSQLLVLKLIPTFNHAFSRMFSLYNILNQ